ncbi:LutC/YkgG family protein [Terrabacter sp. AAH1]
MSARDEMLARIRRARGDASEGLPVPRSYRVVGEHAPGSDAVVAQLVDRLEDYRATVVRAGGDDVAIGAAVAAALAGRGIHEVLHAPGVPDAWVRGVHVARSDDGTASARDLDAVPAVVTGSVAAVSETGTIALDGGPLCGRRALSLVPDTHVCVVRVQDVVQTVPEGLGRLDPTRPTTLISGPSATSDIELSRVEGVHGPRTLVVVLAG